MKMWKWGARTAPVMILCAWVLGLAACDDPFGPKIWSAAPDTAQIWSASRADLFGMESAFSFVGEPPRPLRIESPDASGAWDVALVDWEGGLALAPASWFPGHATSRSAIAVISGTSFDDLRRAPADTASYRRTPVLLEQGGVYVVRTRVAACIDGSGSGVHYAKLRPIEINVADGFFRFETVNNPFCTDRSFVPPND